MAADNTSPATAIGETLAAFDAERSVEDWACDLCFPAIVDVAPVLPGLGLAFFEGRYALVGGQGHELLVSFEQTPRPDPAPTAVLDLFDERSAEADRDEQDRMFRDALLWDDGGADDWCEIAEQAIRPLVEKLGLTAAYRLGRDAADAGWDPDEDGFLELWLYGRIGGLVAASALCQLFGAQRA